MEIRHFPACGGLFERLSIFLDVSAHFEVHFFGFGRKKSCQKQKMVYPEEGRGVSREIALIYPQRCQRGGWSFKIEKLSSGSKHKDRSPKSITEFDAWQTQEKEGTESTNDLAEVQLGMMRS